MRGIALLRNARIQNANDVVNLAFGYASEEDRLLLLLRMELKKKVCPWIAFIPIQWWCLAIAPEEEAKAKRRSAKLSFKKVSGD